MKEASRELLASRDDVWRFFAAPNHLADWWPGIVGVEPDRRGFAAGARWQVFGVEQQFFLPVAGRSPAIGAPRISQTLEIRSLVDHERWAWRLFGGRRRFLRNAPPLEVEILLEATASDRCVATIAVSGSEQLARTAVHGLYDLCQTAASL